MSLKKWRFVFDPDQPCCDEFEENTSHYHCERCGEVVSLMGHLIGDRIICDPQTRKAALDQWRQLDRAKSRVRAFLEALPTASPKQRWCINHEGLYALSTVDTALDIRISDLKLLIGEGE